MAKDRKTRWAKLKRAQLAAEALEILQRDDEELRKSPKVTVNIGGKKRKGVALPASPRGEADLNRLRQINREIKELNDLISPAKGRPPEAIYEQAKRDREANPRLTVKALAEKYLPEYFPDRTRHAIDMMDQGLRRQRRRSSPTK